MLPHSLISSSILFLSIYLCCSLFAHAADNFANVTEPGISAQHKVMQQSFTLTLKAAKQGGAQAQFALAYAYMYGHETEQSFSNALLWLEKAAAQKLAVAQYKLALMYEFGQGVKPNHQKAAQLHLLAAKQGNLGAQHSIGMMYLQGKGVSHDGIKAYAWLAMSADNGFEVVNIARDYVAIGLTQSQLQQAKTLFKYLQNGLDPDTRLALRP